MQLLCFLILVSTGIQDVMNEGIFVYTELLKLSAVYMTKYVYCVVIVTFCMQNMLN